MSTRFIREVLRACPDLRVTGTFFYYPPTRHVLSGFTFERALGAVYIWRHAQPLFDLPQGLTFAYADRLPYPQVILDDLSERSATEFVARIERRKSEALRLRDLEAFSHYVATRRFEGVLGSVDALSNPWYRRTYIAALILLGRRDEASRQIGLLLADKNLNRYAGMADTIQGWHQLVSQGLVVAQTELLAVEEGNRVILGV